MRAITPINEKDFSSLRLVGFGEKYDPSKHVQGTEIKAITYSNMQVHVTPEETNIYVILDIWSVYLNKLDKLYYFNKSLASFFFFLFKLSWVPSRLPNNVPNFSISLP